MTCKSEQIQLLTKYAKTHTREVAAAKAGMSLSTAKRYLNMPKRKKRKQERRDWRTRQDPFADVWTEICELLKRDCGLEAQTIFDWLRERYPDRFADGQIRTLRRRIHDWRVLEGPERKEVFFRQELVPGRQSQSDYTHCTQLQITIAGESFPHMLYHFMLPYSRWEFVWVCFTESYDTLTLGYQKAVKELGAVAVDHRTDNLAAAVPIGEKHVFQKRWTDFLAHYGVHPSANNAGQSNENGSVEKSHDLFKHALDQRLGLRGSRDFATLEEYEQYLTEMVRERNKHRRERVTEELKHLRHLPAGIWNEAKEFTVSVTAWSTISVEAAVYSVPSRFISTKLKVLVYYDRLKIMYGRHVVHETPRVKAGEKSIQYRHLIFHLLKKPGAFRRYQFREELFPRLVFRQAYDCLCENNDAHADKEYLKILHQAAAGSESDVAMALKQILDQHQVPSSEAVEQLSKKPNAVHEVTVAPPELTQYDSLLASAKGKNK